MDVKGQWTKIDTGPLAGCGDDDDWDDEYDWSYRTAAENIASGFPTAAKVIDGWMNSTGHRNNILYEGHDRVGAGCHLGEDGYLYWVIVFYREGGFYPDYPSSS